MTDSEQKLKALLRIRNVRVKKQMAVLKASENVVKSKLHEQETLTQKIETDRQVYYQQQREQTEKLLNNRSGIDDFLLLKSQEETFHWKSKQMTRQGDALVDQIQQSKLDYQNEQVKFKAVEKAVIKIEEFLKLDWA